MMVLGLLVLLLWALPSHAVDRNAASCNVGDVATAIGQAQDGDTVMIPNGSCPWSSGVSTTKQITIRAQNYTPVVRGSTTKNVSITNNAGTSPLISMVSGNSFHVQISGIAFLEGSGTGNHVHFSGSGTKPPRLNDNFFQIKQRNGSARSVTGVYIGSLGLIGWNNRFDSTGFNGGSASPLGTDGGSWFVESPRAWATPSTMGMLDTNGTINVYMEDSTFILTGQGPDIDDNGRVVIRYSTFDGAWGLTHGFSSTFGGRHFEYYNNTISNTYNVFPFRNLARRYFWVRAGTGIWTDNVVNQAVNTSEWGPVHLVDMGDAVGLGPYPVPRQPGWGHNGVTNVIDPIYIWNNTGAIGSTWAVANGWDANIQLNRDFFVDSGAKPGYAKFTYPHPLRNDISQNPLIAAARRTDWTLNGANITNRTAACGSALSPGVTSAQINTIIQGCANNTVVNLNAGVFNLSGSICLKSGVTLRGTAGTILNFTSMGGCPYFWGFGLGLVGVVMQGPYSTPQEIAPGLASVTASTIRNFIGTNGQAGVYTQGATVVNVDTTPTGLSVGDTLVLWQSDDPDASVPNSNFFTSSKGGANAIALQGSAESKASSHQQRVRVTGINGTAITIARGLHMATWNTARAPKAGWFTVAQTLHDAGVENLLIRTTNMNRDHLAAIAMNWCVDCWVKGVAIQPKFTSFHAGGAADYGVYVTDSRNITIRDNWVDFMIGGGIFTTTSYGVALKTCSDCLTENNIFDRVESPMMLLTGTCGSVFGYNYERYQNGLQMEGGFQQHQVGSCMNLIEGISIIKQWSDPFHGSTALSTYFRNHIQAGGFVLNSYHRFYNLIGNVMNDSVQRTSLVTDSTLQSGFSGVGFHLGYAGRQAISGAECNGSNCVSPDPRVISGLMRWGNYDNFGGTVYDVNEVPTADPNFPNLVPPQSLPSSLYLSARPAWFTRPGGATAAFPLIGPDVTGGNISGLAGHANKTPAQVCFESTAGGITSYVASVCYAEAGGGDTMPPAIPTGVTIQ